jgi:hypothetical protein
MYQVSLLNLFTTDPPHLTMALFGLTGNGHGLAAITYMYAAIGTDQGQAMHMCAAHGNIQTMATGGTEDIGDSYS